MARYTFLRFPEFKYKAVTMSFDDGQRGDERLIHLFNEYGIKGTFNLNSAAMFQEPKKPNSIFNLSNVRELYEGHEVAAHGVGHMVLSEEDKASALYDVLQDRRNLEEYFGKLVQGMAYAAGAYDESVIGMLKACNIKYSRTVESTRKFFLPENFLKWHPTCHQADSEAFNLIEEFFSIKFDEKGSYYRKCPLLFYLWGHSYEYDSEEKWARMEDICRKLGKHEDVWYATNGEIFDYVQAYNRLEVSVSTKYDMFQSDSKGTIVHNPSAIDVYISHYNRNYKIGAGQTLKLD